MKLLVDAGRVDLEPKEVYGETPLLRAALKGHEAVVERFLSACCVDVNLSISEGRTLWSYAAGEGWEAVARHLLHMGAGGDRKDQSGTTPLSFAARNGHDAIVKLLLDTGCVDIDYSERGGQRSLPHAAERGRQAAV